MSKQKPGKPVSVERPPDGLWGSRLAKLRMDRGWSQTELAWRAQMNAGEVSKFETGSREPRVTALCRLCRALNVSADFLLGLADQPTPIETPEKK